MKTKRKHCIIVPQILLQGPQNRGFAILAGAINDKVIAPFYHFPNFGQTAVQVDHIMPVWIAGTADIKILCHIKASFQNGPVKATKIVESNRIALYYIGIYRQKQGRKTKWFRRILL